MSSKTTSYAAPTSLQAFQERFEAFVGADGFACVGGRAAVNGGRAGYGLYAGLGEADAGELCEDLYAFSARHPDPVERPASFVAMFRGGVAGEDDFEARMWRQLQAVHEHDVQRFGWDPRVGSDPAGNDFSFSVGGRAYFVVGLHPLASRESRRAPMPCLVFNFHDQFELLRAGGKYPKMEQVTRRRELQRQGSLNPNLAGFGEVSEARQYSGRANDDPWRCPFRARGRHAA